MNQLTPENYLYRLESILTRIENLENKQQNTMQRLHNMMLELQGLVAQVRANARKNDWYKKEINATPISNGKNIQEIHFLDIDN